MLAYIFRQLLSIQFCNIMLFYINFCAISFVIFFRHVSAEVFTAMADMEALLSAERDVVSVIDNYVEAEKMRLKRLQEFAREYQTRNRDLVAEGVDAIANPVNSFLFIKRLSTDWNYLESLMKNNNADAYLSNITDTRTHSHVRFPGVEDLSGAAVALLRLQDTYNLNTHDIAAGKIDGAKQTRQLSAHDCFELGRVAYKDNDFYHTLMWMQEAVNKLDEEDPPTANRPEVLEYLAYAMFQQGNILHAYNLTQELFRIAPDHPRAKGNLDFYEEQLANPDNEPKTVREDSPMAVEDEIQNQRVDDGSIMERGVYEALCRGEYPLDPDLEAKLNCYYKYNDHPFLSIAPFKIEVMFLKPKIVLIRHLIADEEIAVVKELAFPRLARATVQDSVTGENIPATYRISKSAWLKDEEHSVIATLSRRLDMATGLNMLTAEDLQVANYGIGGHYDPHFDFARKEEKNAFKGLNTGNRIATVLFYMSQPGAGGATVFPELKLSLFPSKNDAAFWFNLLKSGEGDMTTRHAGCPVLSGVKWVSNKWIHEYGQESRRPCSLDEYEYE